MQLGGGADSELSIDADRIGWRADIDALIEARARTGVPFTADDIRTDALNSGIPLPSHPSAWGTRFRLACDRHVIEAVGVGVSSRPVRRGLHHRWVGTRFWRDQRSAG